MIIKTADIPVEGLEAEFTEPAEALSDLGPDIEPLGDARGRFSLKPDGQAVTVEGEVAAALGLSCSRCGAQVKLDIKTGFVINFFPLEEMGGEPERELGPGELEVEFYSGGVIDLSGLLREQVLLQVPMKPLCREDCRGICQYCGKDLNEGDCACRPPSGHPGLSALGELLDKMKKEGEGKDG